MINRLRVNNFKPFKDQILNFKPLTLLSGLNSTGKSSVIQALMLLRQSYQQGMLPKIGLALNGDLVRIGTAQDALFEGANNDGLELWSRREELFPHLIFCSHLNKQLENLKSGDPMLRQVERRLSELENYCKIWISVSFNRDSLKSKATPESDSRLNQFGQKLTFRCPDGEKRRFSWHVRMTPGAWRLYFFVDLEPGNLIIGYIGSKIL